MVVIIYIKTVQYTLVIKYIIHYTLYTLVIKYISENLFVLLVDIYFFHVPTKKWDVSTQLWDSDMKFLLKTSMYVINIINRKNWPKINIHKSGGKAKNIYVHNSQKITLVNKSIYILFWAKYLYININKYIYKIANNFWDRAQTTKKVTKVSL